MRLLALGLGVVFVAVAAFEVPRTLQELHRGSAAPAAPAPAAGAAPAAAATAGPARLGELTSFSRFAARDPFRNLTATRPQATATQPAAPKPAPKPKPKPKAKPAGTGVVTFEPAPRTRSAPAGAVIALDGHEQAVPLAGAFPARKPLFRLLAIGDGSVQIGLVGGSFGGGAAGVELRAGAKLTLENAADGSRHVLSLVRLPAPARSVAASTPRR